MKIERDKKGEIVRVPDDVVDALGLAQGSRITLRPIPCKEDEVRYFFAHIRDHLPRFFFDYEERNGADAAPMGNADDAMTFVWSSKSVTYPPR